MTPRQRCCYVLWGDQFDEAAAVLFITTLRAMGLRVWIVRTGSERRASGVHGLQLVADLALDEAIPFADQVTTLIAPCPIETFAHVLHDPRLRDLIVNCLERTVPLLLAVGAGDLRLLSTLLGRELTTDQVRFYPSGELLVPAIQTVARALLAQEA